MKMKLYSELKKKMIDNHSESRYNKFRHFGEVAQLARARGSYPRCRRFKSVLRYYMKGVVEKRLPFLRF